MSDVADWKKRLNRKGPFYLYTCAQNEYTDREALPEFWRTKKDGDQPPTKYGTAYTVFFRDKGKLKIGVLPDGLCCRYGIGTYATLTGTSLSGFWQASNGILSDQEMLDMIAFAKGELTLPEFSLDNLKDLEW